MTSRSGPPSPATRSELLRRGGLAAAGGLVGAGVLAHARGVGAAQWSAQEQQVLNLLLLVERTEVAFYREALAKAGLRGEMQGYAEVVLGHERAHLESLEEALGNAADEAPSFDFGGATGSPTRSPTRPPNSRTSRSPPTTGRRASALERIGVQA
jgi:hypothetical protein